MCESRLRPPDVVASLLSFDLIVISALGPFYYQDVANELCWIQGTQEEKATMDIGQSLLPGHAFGLDDCLFSPPNYVAPLSTYWLLCLIYRRLLASGLYMSRGQFHIEAIATVILKGKTAA